MQTCPQCGGVLPDYNFENIYDEDYGEYEPEPQETERQSFTEHLLDTFNGHDARITARNELIAERIRAEKGWWAAQLWILKQSMPALVIALLYLFGWLPLLLFLIPEQIEEIFWLKFVVGALMPLYGVSLWLLIQEDSRQLPLLDKLLDWALPAFNRLLIFLFFLGALFFLVTLVNGTNRLV